MDVIRNARKRNPFSVCEMTPKDFLDLTSMAKQLTNRKKCVDGKQVNWLDIQSISFTNGDPFCMKFRYVCDEEALWYSVNVSKRSSTQIRCISAVYAKDESRKIKFQK